MVKFSVSFDASEALKGLKLLQKKMDRAEGKGIAAAMNLAKKAMVTLVKGFELTGALRRSIGTKVKVKGQRKYGIAGVRNKFGFTAQGKMKIPNMYAKALDEGLPKKNIRAKRFRDAAFHSVRERMAQAYTQKLKEELTKI